MSAHTASFRMPLPHHSRLIAAVMTSGFLATALNVAAAKYPSLALHPQNPHYFLFRGKPAVIVTSGEHYGAVLNAPFNYVKYLDTLARDGLNGTRTFAGAYCEPPWAFNITSNTLAPMAGQFLAPWARSTEPGYANGGNKFDLTKWNPEYFKRLREFLTHASKRGVIVEMNLFCPFYEESMWKLSPMNIANNINKVGDVGRTNVYTLDKSGGLRPIQEMMARKIVNEIAEFDNVYVEICNEPYFGGVTLEWQHRIADVIVETCNRMETKLLIAQNIANYKSKVTNPHPAISIFNFHYASPPDTVDANYELNKVIGDNETGFKGTNDSHYRIEGWEFLVAGGALYNNLDYSFTVGHEDGTFVYPAKQPGGGSAVLRKQLKILADFMARFDYVRMKPDQSLIKGGVPEKGRVRVLAEAGKQYAVYVTGGKQANLQLELPEGSYRLEWINTKTGKADKSERLKHAGGTATLVSPPYTEDIALRIAR